MDLALQVLIWLLVGMAACALVGFIVMTVFMIRDLFGE